MFAHKMSGPNNFDKLVLNEPQGELETIWQFQEEYSDVGSSSLSHIP